jgi:hypothetical protein
MNNYNKSEDKTKNYKNNYKNYNKALKIRLCKIKAYK